MTNSKFPRVTLVSNLTEATVTGELVAETHTAYQVAVNGKVRSYLKDEWAGAQHPATGDFDNIFDTFFGGAK